MRVAIPSNDKSTIFKHFGRTGGFVICDIENQEITNSEYLENTFTPHAPAMQKNNGNGHGHHHHGHNHNSIFVALADCDVIIAGGMGRRLYDEFLAREYKVFMTQENEIESALNLLISNDLDNNPEAGCHH